MPIQFSTVRKLFYHRKGDPVAEQRRLLEERERIEKQLAQFEAARKPRPIVRTRPRSADNNAGHSEDQHLRAPTRPARHVSWSDGFNASQSRASVGSLEEVTIGMPLRLNIASKRRNAMGQRLHRKSLMQGILSVASGEGRTPASELKEGKKLPGYLTSDCTSDTYKIPDCCYKPLPDPDDFYENKTYIATNQQGTTFRFSESKSLFLFGKESKIRQSCINLFIRPMFSHFIMLVILANCVCMMQAEPPAWIETHLEYVFTAIYCFEAAVKIIGRGFVLHRFAYLRDPWNWLDFVVIIFAIGTEIMKAMLPDDSDLGQFSVLRAFRVLRALKTMSVVPGLRGIVKALLRSIRALQDAVCLTVFCVSVFALIGYQLFHGTLRNKCVLIPGYIEDGPDALYLADWNFSYATYHDDAAFVNFNAKWTIPSSSLYESNITQQYNSSVDLPFSLTPLFMSGCSDSSTYCERERTHYYENPWMKSDTNLTKNIFALMNETLHNESLPNASQTANFCDDIIDQCIVRRVLHIQADSYSSLVQEMLKSRSDVDAVFNATGCQYAPGLPATDESNSTVGDVVELNVSSLSNECNVSVLAFAGNITCMRRNLALNSSNHTSAQDHQCYEDNIWIKTLAFGENHVTRWNTRKLMIFFQLHPFLNSSVSIDDNLYEAFGKEKTHLIFEEYSRKHMTREEQIRWNCADENYLMRKLDSGMYFYTNSSNRPSSEPLYCRIGYNEICGSSHECLEAGGNPDSGYTNYDSFFWAFLTSFRLINQDAWSRLYYLTLHTSGQTYAIFYIVIMFLGSYYLINLILAVVYMAYEEQQAAAEDEALEEEEHKAEIRDFEAASNTEDEVKNSGEDDNGSRSSIYAAAEEGRHTHHLITTSLTSIADSSISRRSRRGSRRSRYGHRRPHVKVDPQSALLYRKFTEQHGDGLSHDSLSPDDRSVRTVNRLGMSRQNSQISVASHDVYQGKEVPYCAQCQQRAQHERSQSTSSQPDASPVVKVVISPDTPIATTENQCNYSFLSPGGTPKPVGTTLKNSTLDVLAVDFGRPPSIYSTGSEGNYELDNDVFLKPGNVQNGDVSNGLRPIPGMARMNDNGGFLVVPFDGVSQSTFSVSSNSDTIDGEEQVVQADVNSAAYLLGPPPSYTESIIGSQRSINLVVPSPAKPPETKKPALPLQVPSLMVTAASTEHILGLEGLQERRPSMDSDIYKNGYCKPRLPAILGSPDGDFNNDIPMDTRSEARLSLKRNNRRNRGSIRSTGAAYESNYYDQSRNAINSIHPQHRLYDETKFGFSQKEKVKSENRGNGCHDNAGLTSIAANMENIEDTKLGAKKRMTKWARNAKLTAIDIFCKWSCCTPRWAIIQGAVRRLVLDPFMDLGITICIFLNTMFMMMEYHPQDDDHVALLERANFVFTMIFAGEMLLKVVGLGPYTYFIETWNVFDAVVVVSSLLEILLQSIPGLSVLRAFRLMRILKLAKSWPTLNKLLRIIGKTLGKLWHLTLVFLLVLFIFAVVGMQLLRDYYKKAYEDHMPRWNFVDFPHAFLVVFRIQCGEWIENMFACMNVAHDGICIPLFILVLVIGNLVILNLFLALLLNSFSGDALQKTDTEINSLAEARGRIVKWVRSGAKAITSCETVTNCCSKLRVQLCYGKRTTVSRSRRIKVEKTTKETHFKKNGRNTLKDSETEITNVPVTSDAHENNNHSIIINEKANLKPKINSVPNDRNMLMLPSRHPHLDKNNDDVASQYSEDPRVELEFKYGRHHRNRRNNLTVHRDDVSCRSEKIRQSESSVVRCRGCNRTFRTGTSKVSRRRQKKINDGFKPAIEFQNRPDEVSDDVSSNRTDEESSLHPPRTPFQAYGNIEYTRSSVRSRTKSDEGRSSDGEKRKRSNTGKRSRQHSDGSDTRNHLIVTGNTSIYGSDRKLSKHSDQEETDSLLMSSRTGQSKRSTRREKRGSTRRKSHETVHSSHTNNSSRRHQQHHNRTSSAASSEAESETPSQGKKGDQIQYCFPPCWIDNTDGLWWKIRKFFFKFAGHRYFEQVVIFCILASSVALAFEDIYLDNNPAMKRVLQGLDKFFCAFFAIEMLIKWVGYGLRFYFTNAWCLLDFVIVFISLLDLFLTLSGTSSDQLGTLRVLRTFRALRPLRALSRFQGMKVVVDALVRAIPSIFNVFLVCVIVWLIFSILGVNLFGGRFGRCVMKNGTTGIIMPRRNESEFWNATEKCDIVIEQPLREDDLISVLNKNECIECSKVMGNNSIVQWYVPPVNFDHVGQGFLSLMQIATFKGWLEIMGNAADITEIDGQPEYEHSMFSYFYFCIFIVFGAFFSLNLFIGVIIDNFNQQKVKSADGEDGVFLTDEQKRYYNAMKKMASKAPSKPIPRPANPFSNFMYTVVTDRKFEIGVMTMIILNMVVMAIEHYGMSPELDHVLQQFNIAFIVIFTLEATMKIIGLRWDYFRFGWNLFDFFVVVVSIIVKCLFTASALSDAIAKYFVQPTLFRIIRLFRVTRILRLIREAKGIRTLLFALMMSLPALFNIGSLLFLVIFIYAILGMSQFAYIRKTGGVDDILNFETFPNTFLVLFQVSTSEGWNTFIEPILSDDCDPNKPTPTGNGDCGNSAVGVAYFVTFVLMTFLIVINMYIAIILENFEVATRESAEPLTADDFEQFFEVWQRFDDKLTQYVTYEQLQHFLHQLDHPLRVPFPNRAFIAHAKMQITRDGKVHCMEVIIALIKKVLGDSPELYNFKEAMLESFMLKCKTKQKPDSEENTIDTLTYARMMWAATVIQGAFRRHKSIALTSESSEDDDDYIISKLESEPG